MFVRLVHGRLPASQDQIIKRFMKLKNGLLKLVLVALRVDLQAITNESGS